ncbi:MAG: ABC transporter permease [Acidobacteria bacterium]|nr:ABC transporter permease [Acidobacteriota bacterium]
MASNLVIDPRRIRTSARFLLRSLSLRHTSFLLALLAVTVAATLTAALLGMRTDLRLKMSRELKGFGPNVLISPAEGTTPATLELSRLVALREALRREGFPPETEVSGMLLAAGRLRMADGGGGWELATLVGADFSTLPRLNPSWKLDGAWPGEMGDGCVVGVSLASRLGLTPGASAEFFTNSLIRPCEVSGLLATGESEDEELFLPLGTMQEMLGMTGRISLAALSVGGGASEAVRAARAVERAVPDSTARVLWQVASAQGALLGKLDRLAVSLSVTVFLLCGLCVMTTLLFTVLEREPEIGLMRSLGAGDGEILVMFLGEVTLLALLGATAGILLGMATARLVGEQLFGTPITPRLEVIPPVLALSFAICWISVLIPLRRALTIQPADALRGN